MRGRRFIQTQNLMHRHIFLITLSLVMLAGAVAAHHGDEFFVLEDYEVPSILGGHLSGTFDWEKYNSDDTFSAETMIMMTIAPQVAFSIGTSFGDHGDGWRYSSVTPRLHVQLTPPKWDFPLRVSLSFGYQFVDGAAGGTTSRQVSVVTYEKVYEQVPYSYTVTSPPSAPPSKRLALAASALPTTPTTVFTTTTTTTTTPGGGTGSNPGGGVVDNPCDPSVDVDCPPEPPPHEGHGDTDTGTTQTTTVTTTQTTSQVSQSTSATTAGSSRRGKGRRPTTTTYTGTTTQVKTVKRVTQVVEEVESETSGSIHNHDENLWTGRLIIEGDFGKTKALFNLIGLAPEGEKPVWGYAAGVRRQITHSFGLGVEAIGDFTPEGMHEVIVGGYVNPSHSLTMKIGAGFGLTEASSDFSIRTGFTYRF